MSNYTITTNFGAKDSLPSGNAGKVIKGSEFTTEFTNIQTAIATKADTAGDTFTGVVNFSADVAVDTNTLFVDVSADKVGIGTTSPASTLHVQASANALQLNNANEDTYMKVCGDRAQFGYRASDGYAIVQGGSNKGIAFGVNNATFGSGEVMRIDSLGNVGIGTNNPSNQFHLKSAGANFATMRLDASGNTAPANFLIRSHDGVFDIRDATNSGTRLTIDSSGNVGIGTASPAESLHTAGNIRLGDTSPAELYTNSNELRIGVDKNNDNDTSNIAFYTNDDEKVRIDKDGKLGIGTTSPSNPLHLKAATNIPALIETTHSGGNSRLRFSTASGTDWSLGANSNGNFTLFDAVNNNNCFTVEAGAGANTLVIDTNNRVGVGTDAPQKTLHVNGGDSDTVLRLESQDSAVHLELKDNAATSRVMGIPNGGLRLSADHDNQANDSIIKFSVDGSDKMLIDATGKVGIGTISPNKTLEVRGEISVGPSGSTDVNQLSVFRNWTSGGDADIYALMPQSSTSSGTILESRPNAHFVIGLKDNDVNDIFSIVSTGGTYDTAGTEADRDYDKLIFCARGSTGFVGVGTNGPQREFEVTGSGNVYARITASTSTDSAGLELANTGATWLIQNDDTSNEALTFDRAGTEVMRIDESGNVGIGTNSPSEKLDIDGDSIRLRQSQTPASATATGTQGQIAWDANYIYVCTATNTWKRVALATW